MKPTFIAAVAGVFALLIYYFRSELLFFKCSYQTVALKYSSSEFARSLLYRIFIPKTKTDKLYPLVLVLHGAAERGSDNKKQIESIVATFLSGKVQKKHPSFLLIPQCPDGTQWVNTGFIKTPFDHYLQSAIPESDEMRMIIRVIDKMLFEYPIDTSKVYVMGFSMGSSGTWDIISRHSDIFAAAVPISGVSDTSVAKKIAHIPVWAFHGKLDSIAPARLNVEMQKSIIASGGTCKLTLFDGIGHSCVGQSLHEPGLIEWIFKQRKI